jgi:hypothetical protein
MLMTMHKFNGGGGGGGRFDALLQVQVPLLLLAQDVWFSLATEAEFDEQFSKDRESVTNFGTTLFAFV